jgi:hypothetical protein
MCRHARALESREVVIDARAVGCHACRARREIRHIAWGRDELGDAASKECGVLGWTVQAFALDVPSDDGNGPSEKPCAMSPRTAP